MLTLAIVFALLILVDLLALRFGKQQWDPTSTHTPTTWW